MGNASSSPPQHLSLREDILRSALTTTAGCLAAITVSLAVRRYLDREDTGMSSARPDGPPSPHEQIFLSSVVKSDSSAADLEYEDVGGLSQQLDDIKKAVILPLSNPSLYQHSRLAKRPTGLLLHGPPGTGKTLLAKIIARKADAQFINVSLGTLLNKWVGESEKLVEALFAAARRSQRAVIFVDECDALFASRAGGGSETSYGRYMDMLVCSFLACWDGLADGPKRDGAWVLVVGATNRLAAIDPAILRRFSRQIAIPLPTAQDRESILRVHLRTELAEPDVDVAAVAAAARHMSGSDLREVTRLAALAGITTALNMANGSDTAAQPVPISTASLLDAVREHSNSSGTLSASPRGQAASRSSEESRGGGHYSCEAGMQHIQACASCRSNLVTGVMLQLFAAADGRGAAATSSSSSKHDEDELD